MPDVVSSRTPEGNPNVCHICGAKVQIEPSIYPRYDAPCPKCGTLLTFEEPIEVVFALRAKTLDDAIFFVNQIPESGKCPPIGLDFDDVESFGSAEIGALLTLHRKIRARRSRLGLYNLTPTVKDILDITKLIKFLS